MIGLVVAVSAVVALVVSVALSTTRWHMIERRQWRNVANVVNSAERIMQVAALTRAVTPSPPPASPPPNDTDPMVAKALGILQYWPKATATPATGLRQGPLCGAWNPEGDEQCLLPYGHPGVCDPYRNWQQCGGGATDPDQSECVLAAGHSGACFKP
jgi:hypothetical protein